MLCWDDKAFYVEQRFVRHTDSFVMAVALVKQSLVNVTPSEIVHAVCGRDVASPEFPEHVDAWIDCNRLCSELLKKNL